MRRGLVVACGGSSCRSGGVGVHCGRKAIFAGILLSSHPPHSPLLMATRANAVVPFLCTRRFLSSGHACASPSSSSSAPPQPNVGDKEQVDWLALGLEGSVSSGSNILVNGVPFTQLECLVRGLNAYHHQRNHALSQETKSSSSPPSTSTVSAAWVALARILMASASGGAVDHTTLARLSTPSQNAILGGVPMSAIGCCVKALELELEEGGEANEGGGEGMANVWEQLGGILHAADANVSAATAPHFNSILIGGAPFTSVDCLAKAVACAQRNAAATLSHSSGRGSAWRTLAYALAKRDAVSPPPTPTANNATSASTTESSSPSSSSSTSPLDPSSPLYATVTIGGAPFDCLGCAIQWLQSDPSSSCTSAWLAVGGFLSMRQQQARRAFITEYNAIVRQVQSGALAKDAHVALEVPVLHTVNVSLPTAEKEGEGGGGDAPPSDRVVQNSPSSVQSFTVAQCTAKAIESCGGNVEGGDDAMKKKGLWAQLANCLADEAQQQQINKHFGAPNAQNSAPPTAIVHGKQYTMEQCAAMSR